MVSTKEVESTIPAIDKKLGSYGGNMVKIEFLENCIKQRLAPDAARFCHARIAKLYEERGMYNLAAKHADTAAEMSANAEDKLALYLLETSCQIKLNDALLLDRAFKKALAITPKEKKQKVKDFFRNEMIKQAEAHEKKGKRSAAIFVYERLFEEPVLSENERREIIKRLASLNLNIGRFGEAKKYEQMAGKPIKMPKEPEEEVKRLSFKDLGLEEIR